MSRSSTCWRGEREDRFLQNTAFYKSFERDLKKLKKDRQMLGRVQEAIGEVEEAGDLQALPSMRNPAEAAGATTAFASATTGSALRSKTRRSRSCVACTARKSTATSHERRVAPNARYNLALLLTDRASACCLARSFRARSVASRSAHASRSAGEFDHYATQRRQTP